MSDNGTASAQRAPRVLPDLRPEMVSAEVRKADPQNHRADLGRCVLIARHALGWSLKELAAKVNRDPRIVARWETGEDRFLFDVLWAIPELREPLLVALARLSGYAAVTTEIRFERRER